VFLGCTFFIPESPRWMVKQGRSKTALMVLARVNGQERAREVCAEVEEAIRSEGRVRFLDLFTAKLRRPLLLALLVCFFSEACGVSVVFYYGPKLLEQAGFSLGSSLGGFGTIAIVNFIGTLFALKFVDSAGRRRLLTVGTIGAIASHIAIGALYLTGHTGVFIVLAINVFVAFFACAIGPIKFVVVSEIFPNRIRGQAVAVATLCIWMTSASVAQLFPVMQARMHTGYIFFCFVFVLLGLLLVIKFMMPETKGRTIEEIERSWF
jgi:MFS family permease